MSGTYASRQASTATTTTVLTRGALAAVGGVVTGADVAGHYQRYGLNVEGEEHEEGEEEGSRGGPSGPMQGRSRDSQGLNSRQAAARKVAPKVAGGGQQGAPSGAAGGGGLGQAQQAPLVKQQGVRGKKGKVQKMKDKYADQVGAERAARNLPRSCNV